MKSISKVAISHHCLLTEGIELLQRHENQLQADQFLFRATVAPVFVALVAPNAPMVPTNEETAAAHTPRYALSHTYFILILL